MAGPVESVLPQLLSLCGGLNQTGCWALTLQGNKATVMGIKDEEESGGKDSHLLPLRDTLPPSSSQVYIVCK